VNRLPYAIVALLLLLPAAARADIYRWEDEAGTIHFTDDLTNVPPAQRGKAKMIIKEAPAGAEPSPPSSPEPGISSPPAPSVPAYSPEDEARDAAREREALVSRVEQLKAKIAAKENLVKTVEDRQNLALNPLRARVLDPGDLELYKKYQAELPEDRERLQELESRLQGFK